MKFIFLTLLLISNAFAQSKAKKIITGTTLVGAGGVVISAVINRTSGPQIFTLKSGSSSYVNEKKVQTLMKQIKKNYLIEAFDDERVTKWRTLDRPSDLTEMLNSGKDVIIKRASKLQKITACTFNASAVVVSIGAAAGLLAGIGKILTEEENQKPERQK